MTIELPKPVGHVNMQTPSGAPDGVTWTGWALSHGSPLYSLMQVEETALRERERCARLVKEQLLDALHEAEAGLEFAGADTLQMVGDFVPAPLAALRAVRAAIASASEAMPLAKHQPCGCVVCTCEDDEKCHGSGAENCGTHPVGQFPTLSGEK